MAFRSPPSIFPSRHAYNFDVAVPDRQLWAIGMVAAQWGVVELFMRIHVHKLVGSDDAALKAHFDAQPDFRHKREIYQTLVETKITAQPQRSTVLALIEDIKRLKHERDRVMHASWGGGMESQRVQLASRGIGTIKRRPTLLAVGSKGGRLDRPTAAACDGAALSASSGRSSHGSCSDRHGQAIAQSRGHQSLPRGAGCLRSSGSHAARRCRHSLQC